MPVDRIQPDIDPRWVGLVESHPASSVFHTPQWLESLRRTYRYTPLAFIAGPSGGPPTSGLAFCQVRSRITGHRLVSLPFSDHCEPLSGSAGDRDALLLEAVRAASGLKYLELRPRGEQSGLPGNFKPYSRYLLHSLDLKSTLDEIYARFHKDSIQRKIRRAEREGLVLAEGRSKLLLEEFYALLLLTRRRHGLPPQPLSWYRNLVECFGERLTIRVARADQRPVAAVLTLRHKKTLVYKYGCSDARFHPMGAMPWLFWKAIQSARSEDLELLDLGRSDEREPGLVRFKERLGARATAMTYWRSARSPRGPGRSRRPAPQWVASVTSRVLGALPDGLLRLVGEVGYRHAG